MWEEDEEALPAPGKFSEAANNQRLILHLLTYQKPGPHIVKSCDDHHRSSWQCVVLVSGRFACTLSHRQTSSGWSSRGFTSVKTMTSAWCQSLTSTSRTWMNTSAAPSDSSSRHSPTGSCSLCLMIASFTILLRYAFALVGPAGELAPLCDLHVWPTNLPTSI